MHHKSHLGSGRPFLPALGYSCSSKMSHRSCPKWRLRSNWKHGDAFSAHLHHRSCPWWHTSSPSSVGVAPGAVRGGSTFPVSAYCCHEELFTVTTPSFPASAYSLGETLLQELATVTASSPASSETPPSISCLSTPRSTGQPSLDLSRILLDSYLQ